MDSWYQYISIFSVLSCQNLIPCFLTFWEHSPYSYLNFYPLIVHYRELRCSCNSVFCTCVWCTVKMIALHSTCKCSDSTHATYHAGPVQYTILIKDCPLHYIKKKTSLHSFCACRYVDILSIFQEICNFLYLLLQYFWLLCCTCT